ncbi:hypothetical protein [Streptomyces sp. NPDC002553]|uniref:hypothetical protein n=1 Tax=Streptomyces sp. NPDC002553 TaxID=3154417 RepID=UPI0033271594
MVLLLIDRLRHLQEQRSCEVSAKECGRHRHRRAGLERHADGVGEGPLCRGELAAELTKVYRLPTPPLQHQFRVRQLAFVLPARHFASLLEVREASVDVDRDDLREPAVEVSSRCGRSGHQGPRWRVSGAQMERWRATGLLPRHARQRPGPGARLGVGPRRAAPLAQPDVDAAA